MNISIEKFCSMIKNKKYFDIPAIQRGFVWKPYQIENLWESLARNFPIGAFTVDDSSNKIQILDGQQRASALAIGYNIQSFNLNSDFRRLFVDIAKPSQETDRKFTFRLITRSHPWGYQLKDNEKTLTDADRRNALEIFEKKGIIEDGVKYYNAQKKEEFFPYDCFLPVPVEFFLKDDLGSVKEWIENSFGDFLTIENNEVKIKTIFLDYYGNEKEDNKFPTKGLLKIYEYIYKSYKHKYNKENNKNIQNAFNILNKKLYSHGLRENIPENEEISKEKYPHFYTIHELHETIRNIKSYQLIFSNLTNSKLKFNEDIIENDEERVLNEEVKTEDIEIIFQRLNRGGTPISEDDLIFSLFKSSFGNTNEDTNMLKNFTENCKGVINPSRLFRLAYLLWEQKERYNNELKKYELVNQRIDYKLAKRDFNKSEFKNFLKGHFLINSPDDDNYFKKFKKIFLYDNEKNEQGLPYPLFIQLCKSAPELAFLMMYRLNIKDDYQYVSNDLSKRKLMIGFFLGLYWFFKGEKERSYRPLLNTIWPLVSFATFENCWSTELLQRCNLMYDYDTIDNYVFKNFSNKKILYEYSKKSNKEKYLNVFRDQILYNNDLVLYAQRSYLNEMFKDDIFSLEDNQLPYDFDHICPSSFRRKKIHKTIKELLDHIGNFRAWPYELNRSDQDNAIPQKFSFDLNKNLFMKYNIDKDSLKEFSLVNEWKEIDKYKNEKLEGNGNDTIRSLCDDIKKRSYRIYSIWFDLVKSIYDNTSKGLFYYKDKDKEKHRNDKIIELINNKVRKNNKNSYVGYDGEYEDLIVNDCIILYLSNNKITKKTLQNSSIDKEFTFTLASYSKDSFKHLCNEITRTIAEYEERKATKK